MNAAPARRLLSLDAFRGMTIAAMILVNNPGSWAHVYAPLEHAEWNGWTPTDLVFPFFLFIVGVAMVFALPRRLEQGVSKGALMRRCARRAAVLFGLGLLLSAFPFRAGWLAHLRIPGVLQRIALCYLLASALFLTTRPRTWKTVGVLCLLLYWALMTWVPVPGFGPGHIEGKDTHLAAYLDRLLLSGHLWRQSRTWDPEGILSTMPALSTCLLGAVAGNVLRGACEARAAVRGLFLRGIVLVVLGELWGLVFPINKGIWTSSYVLFTAGSAMCVLGLCHWLVEVQGLRRWAKPLQIYGVNAITVFVGSGLLARVFALLGVKVWVHGHLLASWLPPKPASLVYALAWVLGWFGALWWLWRRGIVIKV